MPLPTLYVSRLLPQPVMEELAQHFLLVGQSLEAPPSRESLREGFRRAEFVICTLTERIDEELLCEAPRLRIIANYAVGFNNIQLDSARARGIIVTNTPDVLTETTADLTWALLLATARRVVEGDRLARTGHWSGWSPTQLLGTEVWGKTLGIIGLGRIGRAVARRATGFGMRLLAVQRQHTSADPTVPEISYLPMEILLERSDFVTVHVPLTPDTHHLLGANEFHRMRPDAILINTSRGAVINEVALVQALHSGRLGGAGLDVYEHEPQIEAGLMSLPRVVLLPHLGSATLATRIEMGRICLRNLLAVTKGDPPPHRVA